MREKNCIITGGTSGLGLNLVKKFINNGFFVHIIARDNIKIKKLLNYFHEKNLSSFNFYQVDLAEESELNRSIFQSLLITFAFYNKNTCIFISLYSSYDNVFLL